jgi:hypothetical protein
MKTEKNRQVKVYLIIGLGVIFCLVGYYRFFYNKPAAGTVSRTALPAPTVPVVVPKINVQPLPSGEPAGQAAGNADKGRAVKRDIFEPGKSVKIAAAKSEGTDKAGYKETNSPQGQLVLSGMIHSGNHPLAIINGKFQRVGDAIGEYRIVRIGASEVIMKGEDREITLRIVDHGQK